MSGPDYGPVLQYVILVRRGENTSWADSTNMTSDNVAVTNMTVSGLHPFTVYSFRVVAVFAGNVTGVSGESYYMVTLREAPSGSPTITMAHNISSNALYMAWEPPHPLTINGEFLGYKLTYESRGYGRGEGDSKQSVLIKNPDMREYMLRDLATYTQYTLALQVMNPEGEGPATKVMVMTDEGGESRVILPFPVILNSTLIILWEQSTGSHISNNASPFQCRALPCTAPCTPSPTPAPWSTGPSPLTQMVSLMAIISTSFTTMSPRWLPSSQRILGLSTT